MVADSHRCDAKQDPDPNLSEKSDSDPQPCEGHMDVQESGDGGSASSQPEELPKEVTTQ